MKKHKSLVYGRRSTMTGVPMMINLPKSEKWKDSGEGGLAFFFVVPVRESGKSRQVCMAGDAWWPSQNVTVSNPYNGDTVENCAVDAVMLIGSTGQSLWNDELGHYFHPTEFDLNDDGRRLFRDLESIYGNGSVKIVTLLDT